MDEAFPVTGTRSRRLLTALVALAMTASMTFLPGTVQVVQAKEKEAPAAAQKAETPTPSPTQEPEVVVTTPPVEEATAPAPEPEPAQDATTPAAVEEPAVEPVTETPVIVEPTVVEPDASTEGARAPPVETKTDAAPAAVEPAAEILPAGGAGDIVPMNGVGVTDVVYGTPCVATVAALAGISGLNCTANDISLAKATNIVIKDDGCLYPGDTVMFSADFEVQTTATERYDLGIWFATDGDPNHDGALTGTCAAATPPFGPDPPWVNLDAVAQPTDTCGDINTAHNPLHPNVTLTVECVAGADGKLSLPYVTSWSQSAKDLCTSPTEAFPGAPSKCSANTGYTVDIPVPGQIIVDKVTSPPSDLTSFSFALSGTATTGPATGAIDAVTFDLTDASPPFKSANLYGGTYSVVETANASYSTSAVCSDGSPANAVVLSPGEIVTCTFTNTLQTGTLIVNKTLVNDNSGTKACADFSYTVDGGAAVPFESDCSNSQTVLAGSHTVVESGVPIEGYTTTYDNCTNVNVPAGGSATCTITNDDVAVPGMTVEKSSITTSLSAPGTVTYDYLVTNTGNTTLTGIALSDNNDNDDMSCQATTLAKAASMTCAATHTFTQAELDAGGTLDNTVTADSNETESVTDDLSIPITKAPALLLVKTATPTTYAAVGAVLGYSYLVTNTGNVTLAGPVTVADDKATVSCPAGGLAPGASVTCTASYTITQADLDGGSVTNTAKASANGTDSNVDDETVTAVKAPVLTITKVATESTFDSVGDILNYTITATNTGNVTLAVTVADPMVSGLLCTPANGSALAPSEVMTCTATHTVTQADLDAGHWANQACVDDGELGAAQVCADEDVPGTRKPAITVTKTADPGSVLESGGTVAFTFTVSNTSAEPVTITSLTDDKFGTLTGDTDCQVGTVLPVAGSCEFTASFAVPANYTFGASHVNVFTAVAVDDDTTSATASDDATVTYTDVAPTITVTKDANPTYVIVPGGTVAFTYTVSNTSAEPVTITSLTDDKFGTLTGDEDCQESTLLGVGGSCSFSTTQWIGATTAGQHLNVFTATAVDDEGTEATANDNATVDILAPTSKIAPTQTTCEMYRDGTAMDYTELLYNVQTLKKPTRTVVGSVAPGVIFFWNTVTAPSTGTSFTLEADQFNTGATPVWRDMANLDVFLWDANCVKVQTVTLTDPTDGNPTLAVTNAEPGATYYFSVKYDTTSLTGQTVGRPYPTVNYTFQTLLDYELIITSPDSVAVKPKK